jgi:hypothetical protein
LASGVAVGDTLFMVGHRPIDPTTGATTAVDAVIRARRLKNRTHLPH